MFRKNGRASWVLFTEADVRAIQESLADLIFFSTPGNTMIIGILNHFFEYAEDLDLAY